MNPSMRLLFLLLGVATAGLTPVAAAGGEPYFIAAERDSVVKYDLEGNYIGTLIEPGGDLTGASQMAVGPGGQTLYVGTFSAAGNVSMFDAKTGEFLGRLDDGGPLQAPSVISFSHKGTMLVSDFNGGEVYEYDLETNTRLGSFFDSDKLVNPHEVLQFDGGYLVSDYGAQRVFKFNQDGSFDRLFLTANAHGISRPLDMILSDDGSRLYVSNNGSQSVTVYDTTTRELVQTLGGPGGGMQFTEGLAWHPDGSLIVANAGGGNIMKWDVGTGELLGLFGPRDGQERGATDVQLVPTPASASLLGLGGLLATRRRRRTSK